MRFISPLDLLSQELSRKREEWYALYLQGRDQRKVGHMPSLGACVLPLVTKAGLPRIVTRTLGMQLTLGACLLCTDHLCSRLFGA